MKQKTKKSQSKFGWTDIPNLLRPKPKLTGHFALEVAKEEVKRTKEEARRTREEAKRTKEEAKRTREEAKYVASEFSSMCGANQLNSDCSSKKPSKDQVARPIIDHSQRVRIASQIERPNQVEKHPSHSGSHSNDPGPSGLSPSPRRPRVGFASNPSKGPNQVLGHPSHSGGHSNDPGPSGLSHSGTTGSHSGPSRSESHDLEPESGSSHSSHSSRGDSLILALKKSKHKS